MHRALIVIACVVAVAGHSWAAESEFGLCDAAVPREKRALQYNVETRNDTSNEFVAKQTCSDEVVRIKQCAVITIRNEKVQRYCFRKDRPAYYEFFNVIEYWGAPAEDSTAR